MTVDAHRSGMSEIPRSEGKRAFGGDPEAYHVARPEYPSRVFEVLKEDCSAGPGARAFEIGPGTGKATGPLLDLGISHLTAVEPDARLSRFLADAHRNEIPERLDIRTVPFERAELESNAFDLGVAATSFHWLETGPVLGKIFRILRPGGWWMSIWNVFTDPSTPDPFRDATRALFERLPDTPSYRGSERTPFALDVAARTAELRAAGFEPVHSEILRWDMILDADRTCALYATFSQVALLCDEERRRFLRGLRNVILEEFEGSVRRSFLTAFYRAQRPE